jgi:two-component system, chemotaxis family, sensor histidine kinase and response regulator PixL
MLYDSATSDRIYQLFLQEAPEFLEVLEQGLLNIRQGWDVKELNTLMRAAHSIKGCAASVGLKAIEQISHQLEDVFRALYHRQSPIDDELEELLLLAYDCLQMTMQQAIQENDKNQAMADSTGVMTWSDAAQKFDSHKSINWIAQSKPIFAKLNQLLAKEMAEESTMMHSVQELGIDIVEIIFTGDVAQGIKHLTSLMRAAPEVLIGELRAQAEVFIGVGELTNLPGFRAIAAAVLTALDRHPNLVTTINQLAIRDFRSAHEAVLAGDRIQGGVISDRLQKLISDPIVETISVSKPQSISKPQSNAAIHPINIVSAFSTQQVQAQSKTQSQILAKSLAQTLAQTPVQPNKAQPNKAQPNKAQPNKAQPNKAQPNKAQSNEPVAPILSTVLRVDRHRFDRLSAHVGDLVTYESAEQLQQQHLDSIIHSIHHRIEQFEKIQETMQEMSEQNIAPKQIKYNGKSHPQTNAANSNSSISTASITQILSDPLQFDTYTPLQNLTQTTIEELACLKEVVQDLVLLSDKKHQQQRRRLQTLQQAQNDLLWIRMLPIEQILQRFPRMVRDLCIQHQKKVSVNLVGSSTLIDKAVLEKLFDPLVHLVRNAFDHGVESPHKRQAQGKPEQATIEIKAYHRGNLTHIEIRDDGNGIDLEMIKAKAIKMGFMTHEKVKILSDEEVLEIIFEPGFSTAIQVSELSGRGVGLDSVRENLRSLKGDVEVFSEVGTGTMFRLKFPLTLTVADLLIFQIQNRLFAITVDSLSEILVVNQKSIEVIDNQSFYRDGDELILIAEPSALLQQYPLPTTIDTQLPTIELPQMGDLKLLLIESGDDIIALRVDQIIQRREQVIKPFNSFVPLPDYLYGCTVLGNGELVPVLDSHAFIHYHQHLSIPVANTEQLKAPNEIPSVAMTPTLLVVDDTLTMRELLSDSLRQLGFRCLTAKDGREALHVLEQADEVAAIFTDLEMPIMNGFEFIQECRSQYPKEKLPIVVLSSRNGQKHRDLADQLGANEYLTKPFLEHQLIQVLNTCDVVPPAMPARSNLKSN